MNQGLDPSLQRIIDGASGQHNQSRLERPYNFPAAQVQPAEWSFAPAPRQSTQDPMLLNETGQSLCLTAMPFSTNCCPRWQFVQLRTSSPKLSNHDHEHSPSTISSSCLRIRASSRPILNGKHWAHVSYPRYVAFSAPSSQSSFLTSPSPHQARLTPNYSGQESDTFSPRQTTQAPSTVPARLSLAPRSIYSQQDKEPRAITNADHNFKFARNLRQGIPIQQAQQRVPTTQMQSPISQLATNMLLQRPMPKATPDTMSFLQSRHHDRLMELQPAKQQPTPPFNLSEFPFKIPLSGFKSSNISRRVRV